MNIRSIMVSLRATFTRPAPESSSVARLDVRCHKARHQVDWTPQQTAKHYGQGVIRPLCPCSPTMAPQRSDHFELLLPFRPVPTPQKRRALSREKRLLLFETYLKIGLDLDVKLPSKLTDNFFAQFDAFG
ncbi:MAG: hypothetical protein Ct9H300mP19_11050 [Dehalococcoidia bacterium]|nr:MAG: hypothetical protein Ct9H300mP19_11050 [Dehalococcoidia bacterium]